MNARHLGSGAVTLFEAAEDAGLVAGVGQLHLLPRAHAHRSALPGVPGRARAAALLLLQPVRVGRDRRAARGPQPRRGLDRRLRRRGRPLARHARRLRPARLLPLRLRLRLARRSARTGAARRSRARTTTSRALLDAAGGPDEFLERYAVIVCSDHGQTHVERGVSLEHALRATSTACSSRRRTAPGRSTGCPAAARTRGRSRCGSTAEPAVDVALFREDGDVVARRDGRGAAASATGASVAGDASLLDYPDAPGARVGRRSRTRTPARCSSPRPRAASSPTSAAATTPAAAATARSSRATPRCRW